MFRLKVSKLYFKISHFCPSAGSLGIPLSVGCFTLFWSTSFGSLANTFNYTTTANEANSISPPIIPNIRTSGWSIEDTKTSLNGRVLLNSPGYSKSSNDIIEMNTVNGTINLTNESLNLYAKNDIIINIIGSVR